MRTEKLITLPGIQKSKWQEGFKVVRRGRVHPLKWRCYPFSWGSTGLNQELHACKVRILLAKPPPGLTETMLKTEVKSLFSGIPHTAAFFQYSTQGWVTNSVQPAGNLPSWASLTHGFSAGILQSLQTFHPALTLPILPEDTGRYSSRTFYPLGHDFVPELDLFIAMSVTSVTVQVPRDFWSLS